MGATKNLVTSETEYTINTTFKIKGKNIHPFENELRNNFTVIDYRVVPNTEYLYENDKVFQKLVKKEKQSRKEKQDYIQKHNKP